MRRQFEHSTKRYWKGEAVWHETMKRQVSEEKCHFPQVMTLLELCGSASGVDAKTPTVA